MAFQSTYKAQVTADMITQNLKLRLPAFDGSTADKTISRGFSSDVADGCPTIHVGTLAADKDTCLIKIVADDKSVPTAAQNSIGQAQTIYTPHRIKMVFEQDATAQGSLTWNTQMQIMAELLATGMAIDIYALADTTAPSESAGTTAYASAATVTVIPDIWNKLTDQM